MAPPPSGPELPLPRSVSWILVDTTPHNQIYISTLPDYRGGRQLKLIYTISMGQSSHSKSQAEGSYTALRRVTTAHIWYPLRGSTSAQGGERFLGEDRILSCGGGGGGSFQSFELKRCNLKTFYTVFYAIVSFFPSPLFIFASLNLYFLLFL